MPPVDVSMAISLVVPAYNEAGRLPPYLTAVHKYLDERYAGSYEVVVVDDGSRDGLPDLLASLTTDWPELIVLQHPTNRGKGAAVRTGMLAARGELLLFADADGATPIDEEAKLAEAIHAGADLAIGSRLLAGDEVTRNRTWRRALIGRWFARLARWWLGIAVRDTQCGFKMFRHEVGHELFTLGSESGYLFDLELLALAKQRGYDVTEVPINWSDIPGGHLHPTREIGKILRGLWRLRRTLGGVGQGLP